MTHYIICHVITFRHIYSLFLNIRCFFNLLTIDGLNLLTTQRSFFKNPSHFNCVDNVCWKRIPVLLQLLLTFAFSCMFYFLQDTARLEYLIPKRTSLRHRLPMGDQGFIDFVAHLLEINPKKRPSASEALKHPWLSYPYEPISSWTIVLCFFFNLPKGASEPGFGRDLKIGDIYLTLLPPLYTELYFSPFFFKIYFSL